MDRRGNCCGIEQPSHTEPPIVRLTMNRSEFAVFLRSFGDPVCQLCGQILANYQAPEARATDSRQ
jgi:hypothetical protein